MVIIPHDNGGLVAGLRWKATPGKGKDARRPGRDALSLNLSPPGRNEPHNGTDTTATTFRSVPVTGSCTWRKGRLWSLAALAIGWTSDNGYGVVKLGDDDYAFFATRGGVPALNGDICGSLADMHAVMDEFLALTPKPETGWQVVATPQMPAPLADVLPARRRDWPARYRLTSPARIWRRLLLTVPPVLVVGCVGIWGVQHWKDWSERQAREARERLAAMAQQDKAPTQIRFLPHPWAAQPSAGTFITVCEAKLTALPLDLGGWPLSSADCHPDGVITAWVRPKDDRLVTVNSLLNALPRLTGNPVVLIDDDGNSAQIALSHNAPLPAGGDERLTESHTLRNELLSFFQSRGIPPALQDAAPEPSPVEAGVTWIQEWQTLTFSHSSSQPPSFQLAGMPTAGLRLSRVGLAQEGTSGISFTWFWDGEAYGRAPDIVAPVHQSQEEGDTPQ